MKITIFSVLFLISSSIFAVDNSTSYNATCNNADKTTYLCFKNVGWMNTKNIFFNYQTPDNNCKKDTGLVYNPNQPNNKITILEDCERQGGTELYYAPKS